MKTMKKLMTMLMMVGMVFAFPACGGDDDDEKFQDPNEIYDNVLTEGQWSESGNKLIYTHSYASAQYQEKWIFTMSNGVCTAMEAQITCGSSQVAEIVYQGYIQEPTEGVQVSRDGKVITVKYVGNTQPYIGMTKEEIKNLIDTAFGAA
ncbi:MAG: hypothetical protein IJB28_07895 [Bacteroidaceae bacterium]|nr:hypothetical protein [Bacteroidaceae bacterium]MBQ6799814.1 hypothetical protein [Bacteroidaceae bacterium]